MSQRLRRVSGVGIMFATNGAVFASVLPWYPTIKTQWGLSDLAFGLLVAAVAVGSLGSTVLPSWAVNRFGPRKVVFYGTAILALLVAAIGWIPSAWPLALVFACFGLMDAVVDVSQNVAGVRVQDRLGKSIISSLHAFWSLGAVAGGAAGTAAAVAGLDIRVHLGIVAVVVTLFALLATWLTGPVPAPTMDDSYEGDGGVDKRVWASLMVVLPIALVALSGTMMEDLANNWSGLASVELAGGSLEAAGLAFTVMLAAQCIGRFTGDLLINRYGTVAIARNGGVLIGIGGVLVVLATGPELLFLGLAFAGFGCATLVPSAFAAAARIPGLSQGAGVTAVGWLMRLGFLGTSPLIGAISTGLSLRWAFGLLIVIGVLVAFLAPALRTGSTPVAKA
ncbi:MFS transporter [Corynebacterium atrinae]|uniref:MFS transporter n=1 Tax=Corynebacterium atrinae TaxID=1336740 RepID=UPI0025B40559|nr:MFS transporter [Corynebacterium atrinae]